LGNTKEAGFAKMNQHATGSGIAVMHKILWEHWEKVLQL